MARSAPLVSVSHRAGSSEPASIAAPETLGVPIVILTRPWVSREKYSPVLAGFPVQLIYVGVRPRNDETRKPIVVKVRYRFDPVSFFEDASRKVMRYVPNLPSDYRVEVAWKKMSKRWRTSKFEGRRLLSYATGRDFETVMRKTLAVGL